MTYLVLALVSFSLAVPAWAGLTIHAGEIGIGKFHRADNKVHPYGKNNAWKPYVLANDADLTTPRIVDNADGSKTVYFSHLEELLETLAKISKESGEKIDMLNIHAHGTPGGMWFPVNKKTMDSMECSSWRRAAQNSDQTNYNQYYSAVSKSDVMSIRQSSQGSGNYSFSCITGLSQWKATAQKYPSLQSLFADDAQVHLQSCVVGLGNAGERFMKGLAAILFNKTEGSVQAAMKFGLGDWSMSDGMGFWDYVSEEQIEHDAQYYPVNRRDSDFAQKGDIRVVAMTKSGTVTNGFIKNVDVMLPDRDDREVTPAKSEPTPKSDVVMPTVLRIPGTTYTTELMK